MTRNGKWFRITFSCTLLCWLICLSLQRSIKYYWKKGSKHGKTTCKTWKSVSKGDKIWFSNSKWCKVLLKTDSAIIRTLLISLHIDRSTKRKKVRMQRYVSICDRYGLVMQPSFLYEVLRGCFRIGRQASLIFTFKCESDLITREENRQFSV
jgi:hypothetical protein